MGEPKRLRGKRGVEGLSSHPARLCGVFFRCDGFPGACFPVCSPLLPLPPRASAVCFSGAMVFPQCVQARGRGSDAGAQAEEHHAAHAQKGVHRLSSTGHPGSERELAGDNGEAHTVRQARAEKHRAARKPTPYAEHGLRSTVRQARVDKHRATGPEAPGGAPDNSAGDRVLRALTFGARATPYPPAPARTRVWWRRFSR